MPRGRATLAVLTETARAELTALVRRRRTAQSLILRARIVLRRRADQPGGRQVVRRRGPHRGQAARGLGPRPHRWAPR